MASSAPIFDVVGDGELSDAAIEALAALLVAAAEKDDRKALEEEDKPQSA
jgi:hypothetical protein